MLNMATTTNYGWSTPDNTGLVKDGALNIRTLGSAIDTTLASFLNIKQIVTGTTNTPVSNSTTTMSDTGLTASITPSSVNSKILVIVSHSDCSKSNGNAANALGMRLVRGATTLHTFAASLSYTGTAIENRTSTATVFLDSPATTSATTYKTQFNNNLNAATVTVQAGSPSSSILLVELEY